MNMGGRRDPIFRTQQPILAEESGRHLIESLEASFDAATGNVEGAYELPPHIRQRRAVTDVASGGGAWDFHCSDGKTLPVTLVGRDFVAAGRPPSVLVPAGRAVLVESGISDPPQSSHASLIEELRGLAGFGATVLVEATAGSFDGVLLGVGTDRASSERYRRALDQIGADEATRLGAHLGRAPPQSGAQ